MGWCQKNGHIRIPSLKLTTNAPQNRPKAPQKRRIVFQPSIFQGWAASFRECFFTWKSLANFLHSFVSEPPFLYRNNLSWLPQEDHLKNGGFNSSSFKNEEGPKKKALFQPLNLQGRAATFLGLAYWYYNHISFTIEQKVCVYIKYITLEYLYIHLYIYIYIFDNSWVPLMLPMFFLLCEEIDWQRWNSCSPARHFSQTSLK